MNKMRFIISSMLITSTLLPVSVFAATKNIEPLTPSQAEATTKLLNKEHNEKAFDKQYNKKLKAKETARAEKQKKKDKTTKTKHKKVKNETKKTDEVK